MSGKEKRKKMKSKLSSRKQGKRSRKKRLTESRDNVNIKTAKELEKQSPDPEKIAEKPTEKREGPDGSEDSDTLKGVESIHDEEAVVNDTQRPNLQTLPT
ncbi:hypothetical protein ANCCAN_15572 [Ancylostoma caninum]|uniref:Uncharacterized protein n=1 Tax=Ancylostoma caninum TaxID=29170 RepID=A0A368G4A3_ANCCA|nr:hypothetical protein ANCCAN_15572 [Ancylostoma caninum]